MNNSESKKGYGKRPLWQWIATYAVIAIVVYGGIYYFVIKNKTMAYSAPTAQVAAAPVKFSDSPLKQSAFQIYPGTLSAQSKQALNGFKMTTTPTTDGSTQVTLTAQIAGYTTQQYTVKPGFTLYFVEKNGIDDNTAADMDNNAKDDSAILVSPDGFIS